MYQDQAIVMLVEDNEDHAELVKRRMQQHPVGNRVIHFWDGEAALQYLFHQGPYTGLASTDRPRMVLLDLRLPKVDGTEVLREIKRSAATRDIPVVVLTSSSSERDVALAYGYRANSYLVKPLDGTEFDTMLRDVGIYWLQWNKTGLSASSASGL